MKKLFVILLLACAFAQNIYFVQLTQENGEVVDGKVFFKEGEPSTGLNGTYSLKVVGEEVLNETNFFVPTTALFDTAEGGGIQIIDEKTFAISIPYNPADLIEVYKENEKLLSIDVSMYKEIEEKRTLNPLFKSESSIWIFLVIGLIIALVIGGYFVFFNKPKQETSEWDQQI